MELIQIAEMATKEDQRRRNRLAQRRHREHSSGVSHSDAGVARASGSPSAPAADEPHAPDRLWDFAATNDLLDSFGHHEDFFYQSMGGTAKDDPTGRQGTRDVSAGGIGLAGTTGSDGQASRPPNTCTRPFSPSRFLAVGNPLAASLQQIQCGDTRCTCTKPASEAVAATKTTGRKAIEAQSSIAPADMPSAHSADHVQAPISNAHWGLCPQPYPTPRNDYQGQSSITPRSLFTTETDPKRPLPKEASCREMGTEPSEADLPFPEARPQPRFSHQRQPGSVEPQSPAAHLRRAGSHQPSMPLEARFQRIADVVEEAGFDSIDSMMAAYYAATLSEDSTMRQTRSGNQTRRLRGFFSSLHSSHKAWGERERRVYREEIVRAAEGIYAEELRDLANAAVHTEERASSKYFEKMSVDARRTDIVDQVLDILSNEDIAAFLKKDKEILQDCAPETWSLMTELARNAGLLRQQRAQISYESMPSLALVHTHALRFGAGAMHAARREM
ncbi:Uncharacterized protein TCAP_04989 [Tolypocladium capitatum]|uniref:BZIP domain-containing protein n=1 Tax=Tolypocladium capitatum TaxID=45235 RepID=A0A2K3QBY9_9HYPO|nr:Uncharacterized protein TCAP_04989 [Tolypocladium capitatum]